MGWTRDLLVPGPEIEPAPPAMEALSLNHWTAREIPPATHFTQGSNLHLLHWQVDSFPLSHLGSPINSLHFT